MTTVWQVRGKRRSSARMRRERVKWGLRVAILASVYVLGALELIIAAALLYYAGALGAAEQLLVVRSPAAAADAIVVLGGDGPRRAAQAAKLYADGIAPRVVVSGDGDCLFIREAMMREGVPDSAISTECESRTTWENAQRTAPILAAMGVERAVLVTSWYHSRRALASFITAVPAVQWMSRPAERQQSLWDLAWEIDGGKIAKEYPKLAGYLIRYGADPFVR